MLVHGENTDRLMCVDTHRSSKTNYSLVIKTNMKCGDDSNYSPTCCNHCAMLLHIYML